MGKKGEKDAKDNQTNHKKIHKNHYTNRDIYNH